MRTSTKDCNHAAALFGYAAGRREHFQKISTSGQTKLLLLPGPRRICSPEGDSFDRMTRKFSSGFFKYFASSFVISIAARVPKDIAPDRLV
jgi:hypothetical protein